MAKKMQKMFALLLTVSMLMSMLSVTAMAAETVEKEDITMGKEAIIVLDAPETGDAENTWYWYVGNDVTDKELQPIENGLEKEGVRFDKMDETSVSVEAMSEGKATVFYGEEGNWLKSWDLAVLKNAAEIDGTGYETLDKAVAAAVDGDTIKLLADYCGTKGWNLSKNLTIYGTGEETVVFTGSKGIWLTSELTFSDCNVVIGGNVVDGQQHDWLVFGMTGSGKFNLNNVDMTMTGGEGNNDAAFYMCAPGNDISLTDSTLTIKNYKENAFAVDTPVAHGYKLTMVNSELTSDGNRACFAAGSRAGAFGCMDVSLKDSELTTINSTDDGCSGAQNFYIDNSKVYFKDNRSRGIRAYDMEIKNNSVVTVTGNHASFGLSIGPAYGKGGSLEMDGTSELYLTDNTGTGLSNRGVSHIAEGAVVSITGNGNCGIKNYNILKIDKGVDFTLVKNSTSSNGGGIYNNGFVVVPVDAEIYNNHAKSAGDDIYNYNYSNKDDISITFGKVGSDWMLDGVNKGDKHCTDAIDGWYYDGYRNTNVQDDKGKDIIDKTRWEAHAENLEDNHIVEFTDFDETGVATLTGTTALKATHGLLKELTVEKIWDDNGDKKGIRPDSILVDLYENGELAESVELNEDNEWQYTWTSAIDSEWTVTEEQVDGYKEPVITCDEDGLIWTVTNTVKKSGGNNGGGGGTDPDPKPDPDPVDPPVDIEDPDVPTDGVDPEPPVDEIPDEEIPKVEPPKTGDMSALWLAMSALSGTGLAASAFLGRKKKEDQ